MTLASHQNGTIIPMRGRAVVPRNYFTFPSSGITVEFHKVSMTAWNAIQTAVQKECQQGKHPDHPYPKTPMAMVDVGGEMKLEEVRGGDKYDQYIKDLEAWNAWATQEVALRFLAMLAVDYMVVDDDQVATEVDRMRKALQRQGADLPPLGIDTTGYSEAEINRMYFLVVCCMIDQEADGMALMGFISSKALPREEAIQDRVAEFRPAAQSDQSTDIQE